MSKKLTRKEKIALQQQQAKSSGKTNVRKQQGKKSPARILAFIVAIAGFLVYANTLSHDFVLDDFGLIKDNTQTKQGISAVPEIFASSYRFGMNVADYQLYRPLSKAMFAIEWGISPDNPALGHFMNVLLFAITCLVVFRVLHLYTRGELFVPFVTALLFAVHPLHTEVVANIKSRDEIMCFLLCLFSVWMVHKYVMAGSARAFLGAIAFYFIALFSKESAVTFIAVVPLLLYFFTDATKKQYLKLGGAMVFVTLIFLLIRRSVLGSVETNIPVVDNYLAGIPSFLEQRTSAIYLLGIYMKKFLLPFPLVSDGSFNSFPVVGFGDWRFLLPFVILTGALVYAIIGFRKKDPAVFAILYFFVTVSIVSNVIILIGTNYGERLMYMPSLGFCMLVAIVLRKIFKADEEGVTDVSSFATRFKVPLTLTLIASILFSYQAMGRNMEWKDNFTLYSTDVQKVPNSAHMLFYLANHLTTEEYLAGLPDSMARRKSETEALNYLSHAIEIYPEYADAFQRRGYIFFQRNEIDKAEKDYKEALEHNPTHPITYNNYGSLMFKTGRYNEALEMYQKALRYNPRYAHALNNIASVYGVFGESERSMIASEPAKSAEHQRMARQNFETAITYFRKAIDADPEYYEPYRLLSITYRNIGDEANADKYAAIGARVQKQMNAKN